MNKTLIAMAVAGLMAAPMAAQADATIYGKLHVSIDSGDTGGNDGTGADAGNKSSGLYWQSNSSRIGFKGSEDLGGGLKAIWQIENAVGVGSSNTITGNDYIGWGQRNTYVGLQGGWGTFLGGKHDTPFKTTGRKFDLFGDYVGDSRNLISGKAFGDNWDARPDNVIMYKTPVFGGGWDISAMYVLDDATEDSTALSANINWKTGNWFTSLAYETRDKGLNNGTLADGTVISANPVDSSAMRLGVYWTPGAWKLAAFYHTASDANGIESLDQVAYGLGAAYKMGKNVLKAQYYMTANDAPGASDIDANTLAIAWDYNFSKRTTGYIAYAATSNDDGMYEGVDQSGHGGEIYAQAGLTDTNLGDDPSAISLGVIHKF